MGVTVWGVLGEAGRVLGGVETLSGADMRELGLLRLIILGLRLTPLLLPDILQRIRRPQ